MNYLYVGAGSFVGGLVVMGVFYQRIVKDYEKAAAAMSLEFRRVAGSLALVKKAI